MSLLGVHLPYIEILSTSVNGPIAWHVWKDHTCLLFTPSAIYVGTTEGYPKRQNQSVRVFGECKNYSQLENSFPFISVSTKPTRQHGWGWHGLTSSFEIQVDIFLQSHIVVCQHICWNILLGCKIFFNPFLTLRCPLPIKRHYGLLGSLKNQ